MIDIFNKVFLFTNTQKSNFILSFFSFLKNFKITIPFFFRFYLLKKKIGSKKKIKFEEFHKLSFKIFPPERKKFLIEKMNMQINLYKKLQRKNLFTFLEIGSLYGESLITLGEHLASRLDNFKVISIDPYQEYSKLKKENLTEDIGKSELRNDQIIREIYSFFQHNTSCSVIKKNFNHLRMTSDDAFKQLASTNFRFDFCYIDGLHYYANIKKDFENYYKLSYQEKDYKSCIVGDDYEYSFNEIQKLTDMSSEELEKKIQYFIEINADFASVKAKDGKKISFHPGITYYFKDNEKVFKDESGIWYLE